MQKYAVNQYLLSNILSWVQSNEIAIPEIQRPFVWNSVKVRDLIDSLYRGYPIGYIIAWKNPNVRLRNGGVSEGKKILIDGQQRITALRAAVLGELVVDKEYKEKRIIIAFNPIEEKFETLTPAIEKDVHWIPDISEILKIEGGIFDAVRDYKNKNRDVPPDVIEKHIDKLLQIKNRQIGFIDLEPDLDIETVTDIFVRINSKGVVLGQADFVMSKIASYDTDDYFGENLRKVIDYFCHLAKEPQFYKHIHENDEKFRNTNYFEKISWLKNENDDLYDPDYSDVLRVSFTMEFERGKLSDLVALLSGRNFETKTYEKEIMDLSFQRLSNAIQDFINETNFKRFVMIVKSAGFISKGMISSKNVLNFAYVLYLKLRRLKISSSRIEKYVKRWLVMALLTNRYSGSSESIFDADIKGLTASGIEKYLKDIEDAQLSDTFWNVELIQKLNKSLISSSELQVFFASQIRGGVKGFLSRDITVSSLILHRGDVHHIFPKEYLKTKYPLRGDYNQIANFVYAQSEINIKIGKKAPKEYFKDVIKQTIGGKLKYGGIAERKELEKNLRDHCIPDEISKMDINDFENFLDLRKKLIAARIRRYYKTL